MPTREAPTCGGSCGVERWAVKTLSDPDRERVQLSPVNTTVEALVTLQRPAGLPATRRADPTEVTVYRVEARLLSLFSEADGDYHLVLASTRDASITGRLIHDLRRTAARDFRRAGVSEGEIMRLCGWETRTMFDRYKIIDEADLAAAVAKGFNGRVAAESEPSTESSPSLS